MCRSGERSGAPVVESAPRLDWTADESSGTAGLAAVARRMLPPGGMRDRTFWHSDPEALLADAARALDAKRQLARHIDRDWSYVVTHLGEVLLKAVRDVPDAPQRRRRDDRRLLDWVGRLVAEIPEDDPYRDQVLRRLRQVI